MKKPTTRSCNLPLPHASKFSYLDSPDYELENFAVVQHSVRGLEVITLRPIERGATILEYKGDLITRAEANVIEEHCKENNIDCDKLLDFGASGGRRLCINALAPSRSLGRLLSHSTKPNCVVKIEESPGTGNKPRAFIRALMDIQKYQLLLWYYPDPRKEIRDANPWMDEAIPFSEQFHFIQSMEQRFDAGLNRPVYIAPPIRTSPSVGFSPSVASEEGQGNTENSSPANSAVLAAAVSDSVGSPDAGLNGGSSPTALTSSGQPPQASVSNNNMPRMDDLHPDPTVSSEPTDELAADDATPGPPGPAQEMDTGQCCCSSPDCTFPPEICQLQEQVRQKPAQPVTEAELNTGKGRHFDLMDVKCRTFEYATLHSVKVSKDGKMFCSFKIGAGSKVFHNYSIDQVRQTQLDDALDQQVRQNLTPTELGNRETLRSLQGANAVRIRKLLFEITWNDTVTETLEIRHHIPGQQVWDPTKFDNLWLSPKDVTRKVPYSAIEFTDQPFMVCKANSTYNLPVFSTMPEHWRSGDVSMRFQQKPPEFDAIAGEIYVKPTISANRRSLTKSPTPTLSPVVNPMKRPAEGEEDDDDTPGNSSVRTKKRYSAAAAIAKTDSDDASGEEEGLGLGMVGSPGALVGLQAALGDYRSNRREQARKQSLLARKNATKPDKKTAKQQLQTNKQRVVKRAATTLRKSAKKQKAHQPHDIHSGAMGVTEEDCALCNEQKSLLKIHQLQENVTSQINERSLTSEAVYPTMEPNNPSQLVSAITALVTHILEQKLDGFDEQFGVSFDSYTRKFDDSCAASIAANIRKLLEEKVDRRFDDLRTEFRNQFKSLMVALTGQEDFDRRHNKPKPIIESLAEILLKLCPTETVERESHAMQTSPIPTAIGRNTSDAQTSPICMARKVQDAHTSPMCTAAKRTHETQTSPAPPATIPRDSVPTPQPEFVTGSQSQQLAPISSLLAVSLPQLPHSMSSYANNTAPHQSQMATQVTELMPQTQVTPRQVPQLTPRQVHPPPSPVAFNQQMCQGAPGAPHQSQMVTQVTEMMPQTQVPLSMPQMSGETQVPQMTPRQVPQLTPRQVHPPPSPVAFNQQMHQGAPGAHQFVQQHAFHQSMTLAHQGTTIQQLNGTQMLIQPSPRSHQGPPSNAVTTRFALNGVGPQHAYQHPTQHAYQPPLNLM